VRLVDRVRLSISRHPVRLWRAYQELFSGENSKLVLTHLADLCGVLDSVDSDDPIVIARAEGRRQVFLAIMDMLGMGYKDVAAAQKHIDDQLGGER
jgi:hypothetical protein